jgi:hypothetical protein
MESPCDAEGAVPNNLPRRCNSRAVACSERISERAPSSGLATRAGALPGRCRPGPRRTYSTRASPGSSILGEGNPPRPEAGGRSADRSAFDRPRGGKRRIAGRRGSSSTTKPGALSTTGLPECMMSGRPEGGSRDSQATTNARTSIRDGRTIHSLADVPSVRPDEDATHGRLLALRPV